MDDVGSSSAGCSSSDAAGFSNDTGGCSAFTSSDTGGFSNDTGGCSAFTSSDTGGFSNDTGFCSVFTSSATGGFSDSGQFIVDTFSNSGMTNTCDPGLDFSGYAHCDFTGNNVYYHPCYANSIQGENMNDYITYIHVNPSVTTGTIPESPFVPYLTTPTDREYVEGRTIYIPRNIREDRELMILKSRLAQMQSIMASSKLDEYKKATLRAHIRNLSSLIERHEKQRRHMVKKCQKLKQKQVPEVTKVEMPGTNQRNDTENVDNKTKTCRVIGYLIIIAVVIAIALGVGLGLSLHQSD